jgi:hypothetical protein
MIRFSLDLALFCNRLKSTPNPDQARRSMAATMDGCVSRVAGLSLSLTLARSWRGPGRGSNADARACALKMMSVATLVLSSEVWGGDAVRSEGVVDVNKGGIGINPSAIATMSAGRDGSAAAMARTDTKPAQNTALTCARKL